MNGARERFDDPPGVGLVLRLADHLAVQPADRVGGDDEAVIDLRGHGRGLQPREFADVMPAVAEPGFGRFVDVRGLHVERVPACSIATGGRASRWPGSGDPGRCWLPRIEYLCESRPEPVGCQFRHADHVIARLQVTPAQGTEVSTPPLMEVYGPWSATRVQVYGATHGRPSAAARWSGPVSLPTMTSERGKQRRETGQGGLAGEVVSESQPPTRRPNAATLPHKGGGKEQ